MARGQLGEKAIQDRFNKVNEFTEVESAWLAAAIDGEGCIRIFESNPNTQPGNKTIKVFLTNTSKEFIEEAKRIIGEAGIIEHKAPYKSHWQPQFVLVLNGWVAVPVLMQIEKYLIIKRDKALEAIVEMESKKL